MQKKVNVLTDTKAIELVQDDSGRVIGIKAASKGDEFFIRARKRRHPCRRRIRSKSGRTVSGLDPRLKGLPSN